MLALLVLCGALRTPSGRYEYRMTWPVRQHVSVRVDDPSGTLVLFMDGVIDLSETRMHVDVDAGWEPAIPAELEVALRKYRCSLLSFDYSPTEDVARVRMRAPVLGECTVTLGHVED